MLVVLEFEAFRDSTCAVATGSTMPSNGLWFGIIEYRKCNLVLLVGRYVLFFFLNKHSPEISTLSNENNVYLKTCLDMLILESER